MAYGRKSSSGENPMGKAARPRGGAGPKAKGRQPSTMKVSSGTSGRALRVTGKQR